MLTFILGLVFSLFAPSVQTQPKIHNQPICAGGPVCGHVHNPPKGMRLN